MNLKDFLATRDNPPELYWSLVIEKGWVQAGIWYIGDGAAEVVSISPPAAWEMESELVGACDAALSSAVAKLPENYNEPTKTVFGVVSGWVKDGEIGDAHLAKIKTVCTELSLTPVGFVVLPEAIAHLYKSEDGTPLSAVIIGLGSEDLEVSVFKLGNLAGTTVVARSVSLTDDVTEGLNRFESAAPLPSRIILYDGRDGELEDAKEELIKNSWEETSGIKFLHTPNVEILSTDRKVLATSLAGAAEIGNIQKINKTKDEDEPIAEKLPPTEEIENFKEPDVLISAEDLGFLPDEDITKSQDPPVKTPAIHPEIPTTHKQHIQEPISEREVVRPGVNYLQKTKKLFHGFSSKVKIHRPEYETSKPKPIKITLIVLGILVVGIFAFLWFIPKAAVTVYVSPKTYQEQVGMVFNTDGQYDETKALIPGNMITSTATGSKTKSTTGTKLVGEKASGSVQIANGNSNPIRLTSGTILTSASGLKFQTDNEASISGQLIPGSPGTATVSVKAVDIGAQYNLARGEIFKVGLFDKSQVAATSQNDFAGGSSQQIAAVSADDQKKLEEELKQELSAQIMEELMANVSESQIFVNDLSLLTIADQTFDNKVGDVADTLKLDLTIEASGVAADKSKLLQYTTDSLKSKIPVGFALRSSQIEFKFSHTGTSSKDLSYTVDISANFLPSIKVDEMQSKIAGKTVPVVEEYLSSIPGYTRAEVRLKPNLPGPFAMLPRIKKNITIEISSEN